MIVLHYGHHPGTTGVHFAAAAGFHRGRYVVIASRRGDHLRLTREAGIDGYLWIESGVPSYPLDAHAVPFPTGGYLIDVHLHLPTSLLLAALFDIVFVAQKDYLEVIRRVNPGARWLPLASPSSFVSGEREPRFDIGFVGQARPGTRRERVLRALNSHYGMNDWRRPHSVEEMRDVYRRSRVVVNDPINGEVNMRFFEAMASGAVVLSPALRNGLEELVKDGQHYVVGDFDDVTGLLGSVAQMLNSTELEEIGERARTLVAQRHTYDHRLATMTETLASAPLDAPIRSMSARDRARHLAALAESVADEALAWNALRLVRRPDRSTTYRAARAIAKSKKRKVLAWRCSSARPSTRGGVRSEHAQ